MQGVDGNFYGTTRTDGVNHAGTVFKLTPSGTLTTLYHFCSQSNCTDGATPNQVLQLASDGNFYGTTLYGGVNGPYGTVFKVTPAGTLTTLYSFCLQTNCADGDQPYAGLALGADGNFYGTTSLGGADSSGTIFKITTGGSFTLLHSFNPNTDGTESHGPLVQTLSGNFYGTTRLAGVHGGGTIFQMTPTGTFTTLYNFCTQNGCTDGSSSFAGLIATRGNFYGTTSSGGSAGNGTVFSLSAPTSHPVQFVPLSPPCRLLDTRSGNPIQGRHLPDLQSSAAGAKCVFHQFVFGRSFLAECHAGANRWRTGFVSHHLAYRTEPACRLDYELARWPYQSQRGDRAGRNQRRRQHLCD